MQKARIFIKFFIVCVFFMLSACLSRHQDHGYIFESIKKDDLRVDLSSKNEVFAVMGSPTVKIYEENGEHWVYFSENVKKLLFFKPKIVEREVFVVKFNDSDKVKEFATYSLNDQRKIDFEAQTTAVLDRKPGFFKSIIGNIGQVTPQ